MKARAYDVCVYVNMYVCAYVPSTYAHIRTYIYVYTLPEKDIAWSVRGRQGGRARCGVLGGYGRSERFGSVYHEEAYILQRRDVEARVPTSRRGASLRDAVSTKDVDVDVVVVSPPPPLSLFSFMEKYICQNLLHIKSTFTCKYIFFIACIDKNYKREVYISNIGVNNIKIH